MLKSIKSFSKRTVSIILSLMMIISMMLVGMVTANAGAGSTSGTYYFNSNIFNKWNGDAYDYKCESSNNGNRKSYTTYLKKTDSDVFLRFYSVDNNNGFQPQAGDQADIHDNHQGCWGTSNSWKFSPSSRLSSSNYYYKVIFCFDPAGGDLSGNNAGYAWYETTQLSNMSPSITNSTSVSTGSTVTLSTSITSGSAVGNVNYSYAYSTNNGSSYTNLSGNSWTPSSPGTYTIKVTATDTGVINGRNSLSTRTETATKTFTVTNPNYVITTKAKVQTFNFSTGSYNSVTDASSSQGTVSANPTSVTPGSTTKLTATPGSGYSFAGWFTSSNCSGTAVSTSNPYTVTPTANTTYYALFKQNYETKTLSVESNSDAVVTVTYNGTNYAEGSTATIPVGATVTVKVTGIASGKYCSSVKAGTVNATASGSGTFTFTMPASNVSVVATIEDKVPATVSVSSNDTNLGTAVASPNTNVYVGDIITLTATATNGAFKNWTITGATYNSGYSSNNATVQVTVTGNVTAIANFDVKTYEVSVFGSSTDTSVDSTLAMKATDEAGVFISTTTLNNNKHFTIKRLSDNNYAVSTAGDNAYYINSLLSPCDVKKWESSRSGLIYYTNAGQSVYIVYDSNEDEVYLTTDPNNKKIFEVFAKDGTNRNSEGSFTADNLSKLGETRIDNIKGEQHTDYYQYSIAQDTVITFTTTLTDTYANAGFYVGAFCVNGKYVEAIKKTTTKYTSANYTLTNAEAVNNRFEITPVYYNKNIDDNNDYITFYVDADEVNEEWGDTIAVDAYSYISGNAGNADHLFGTYPGQPMYLNRNGYYEIKVPKYRYYMDGSTYKKDSNSPVSGITMTSYHADFVHHYVTEGSMTTPWNTGKNYQTYDYADFVTIAQLEDVQTIMFENKWYSQSAKNNDDATQSSNLGKKPTALTNINPFVDFTDYYGKKTDILGNILTDAQINGSKKLYVISQGNYNTNDNSGTDYATEGQWATMWYVYKETGEFIVKATPADFVLEDSFAYDAIVDAGYEFAETKISFDKEKKSSVQGDSGVRSDGRWYYSRLGLEFTSKVEIEYKDDNGSFVLDSNTNTENTGFIGQTTNNSTATINGKTESTFTQVDEITSLRCNVANGWQFVGWYIKETDADGNVTGYRAIGTTTAINDFKMSNAYTLVARVEKIPVGALILTHSQYTGSDPAAHEGTGDYYISAVVKDSNGNVISTVADSKTAISVPNLRADYTIEITLRTVCHGDNTFYAWYEIDNGKYFEIAGETEDPRGKSDVTYSFTVDADKLFGTDDKLAISSLDFYSDIVKISAFCTIEYRYYDRFEVNGEGSMVSYIVRDIELTTEEIENGYVLSRDDIITQYAPEIDTMYVDTDWKIVDMKTDPEGTVDKTKCYVIVNAIQVDKNCKVLAPKRDEDGNYIYSSVYDETTKKDKLIFENEDELSTVEFNSWYIDSKGNFILEAPQTLEANGKKFNFARWEVYNLTEQGAPTNQLVTVLPDRVFTLRIMADYLLVPVYEVEISTLTTHISAPIYNREVWGEATNPTDRLYVDFLVAFTSTQVPVFKENDPALSGYTVECGIIVDRNNKLTLSSDDRNAIIEAAKSGAENPLDMSKYKAQFGTDYEKIKDVAFNSAYVDKDKVIYNDANSNEHRLTKYVFTNSQLTNKNRIDKVLVYTNNEANQNYIFAAYTYVILTNIETGEQFKVITTVDDAQFYNLCYKGNEPYKSPTT